MDKQIATIFSLLSFNYLMFKYWGTWKVTLLALNGINTKLLEIDKNLNHDDKNKTKK